MVILGFPGFPGCQKVVILGFPGLPKVSESGQILSLSRFLTILAIPSPSDIPAPEGGTGPGLSEGGIGPGLSVFARARGIVTFCTFALARGIVTFFTFARFRHLCGLFRAVRRGRARRRADHRPASLEASQNINDHRS